MSACEHHNEQAGLHVAKVSIAAFTPGPQQASWVLSGKARHGGGEEEGGDCVQAFIRGVHSPPDLLAQSNDLLLPEPTDQALGVSEPAVPMSQLCPKVREV